MRSRALLVAFAFFLAACAGDRFVPPPVSSALVARATSDGVSAQQLKEGRVLFTSRCIECHTLPPVSKYSREQWPHLVSRMSARANLTAAEEQSIISYVRAAASAHQPVTGGDAAFR